MQPTMGAALAREIAALIEQAIAQERRACAAIAEEHAARYPVAREIAARIRERSADTDHL